MARQVDGHHLAKVGMEGFAMLEESRRRFGRVQQYLHPQLVVYQVAPKKETVMDSNQVASMYGGVSIIDYGRKKPQRRWVF